MGDVSLLYMERKSVKFEDLYHRFHAPISTYMTRMVGAAEAADATQEVFTKVNRGLQSFEGRSRLSTWIYRIATNTALDRLRSSQSSPPEIPLMEDMDVRRPPAGETKPSTEPSPLQQVIHTEMNDCIREQVDKLPEKYRTVMILSALEELKLREVADILDISIENAKIRLHRARVMLKKILENECRFYHNAESGALSCDRKD